MSLIHRRKILHASLLLFAALAAGCYPKAYDDLADRGFTGTQSDWRSICWCKNISDDDLIASVPDLQKIRAHQLYLYSMHISDRSIPYILKLPSLEVLDLSGTDVTITGLQQLVALPHLKRLYLSKSYYHPQELQALSELLPSTKISEDSLGTKWRLEAAPSK